MFTKTRSWIVDHYPTAKKMIELKKFRAKDVKICQGDIMLLSADGGIVIIEVNRPNGNLWTTTERFCRCFDIITRNRLIEDDIFLPIIRANPGCRAKDLELLSGMGHSCVANHIKKLVHYNLIEIEEIPRNHRYALRALA